MLVTYADGEETLREGDVFYVPPGHAVAVEQDVEYVGFSPPAAHDEFMAAAKRNTAGAAARWLPPVRRRYLARVAPRTAAGEPERRPIATLAGSSGGTGVVAHILLVPKQYPDPRTMGPYGEHVEATMALHGGGYRSVLRHRVTVLEGDWHPAKGVVILEFPSYDQALAWYRSPEYAPLLDLRTRTGRFDTVLVDGISEDDPAITGRLDQWEIERIAELEAEKAQARRGEGTGTS